MVKFVQISFCEFLSDPNQLEIPIFQAEPYSSPYILFVQIIRLYKGAAFTSRLCKHANDNEISPNQCHIHFGMNECMNNKAISSRGKWPVQETDKINEMGGRQSTQNGSLLTTLLTQIMQSTCKSLHFKKLRCL